MKTKEQIIESIKKWYGMGADKVSIYDDVITKSILYRCDAFTNYSREAICGENPFSVVPHSEWEPNQCRMYKLSIIIYY